MKAKLIKTEEGYYLVDNSKILKDQYYLAWENYYSSPRWIRYVLSSGLNGDKQFNIIASNIDLDNIKKLSKENCDEIFGVVDVNSQVEDIVKTICPDDRGKDVIYGTGMAVGIQCFNKAMELNKDKVFTEDDVNLAFVLGKNNDESRINKLINSRLQPTEIEVEIEIKRVVDETKVIGVVKGIKGSGDKITTYKSSPKLDADGCLILRKL
jgi:hypothetical protein